jgi:hypothetical protein
VNTTNTLPVTLANAANTTLTIQQDDPAICGRAPEVQLRRTIAAPQSLMVRVARFRSNLRPSTRISRLGRSTSASTVRRWLLKLLCGGREKGSILPKTSYNHPYSKAEYAKL